MLMGISRKGCPGRESSLFPSVEMAEGFAASAPSGRVFLFLPDSVSGDGVLTA